VKEDDEEYVFTEENDLELKSISSQTTTSNRLNFVGLLTQQGFISRTADSFAPDPDITDDPTTSPAS
ncbi:unnamed protein product, partial [Rotaria magnacalcarata]